MKPKLYLESTIPSYFVASPSRSLIDAADQQITHQWWNDRLGDFDIYISQVVLDEIGAGDPRMAQKRIELVKPFKQLVLSEDARALTKALLHGAPLPAKAAQDAAHIAIAAVYEMNILLTWNCRHIANSRILRKVEEVCRNLGYTCPFVFTPRELLIQ